MTQLSVAVLQLDTTSCKARQVKTVAFGRVRVRQGLLDQAIHATPAFMLTVGQHNERSFQLSGCTDVGRIHPPREWILHQLHADAIEVLHDQQILCR